MSDKVKEIEIIPIDCEVTMKVSGDYIARFYSFIQNYFPYRDQKHYAEVIKSIKENTNNEDPFVYHLKTLLAMQAHFEVCAKEQNVLKKIKYDYENDKVIEGENQPAPQSQEQSESPDSTLP